MTIRHMALTAAALSMASLMAYPALAQDRVEVPLPDLSQLDDAAARDLAQRIARADVITSTCDGFSISGGEWTLLAGSSDLLAQRLAMDPAEYDQSFNAPAYGLLDEDDACAEYGPMVQPLIGELVAMGGATRPDLPDDPAPADGTDLDDDTDIDNSAADSSGE